MSGENDQHRGAGTAEARSEGAEPKGDHVTVRLELRFEQDASPYLAETQFNHPEEGGIVSTRGDGPKAFQWRKGTRALCVFFLHQMAWALSPSGDRGDGQPWLEGKKGSRAATLNWAFTRPLPWMFNIFGSTYEGKPFLETLVERKNRDFRKKGPVRLQLRFHKTIEPQNIHVYLSDAELTTSEEMTELKDAIVEDRQLRLPVSPTVKSTDMSEATREEKQLSEQRVTICPPPPSLLIGRDDDLDRLTDMLARDAAKTEADLTPSIVTIHGWPGIGKTTLAAALANDPRMEERFPDGTLWCAMGPDCDPMVHLAEWASVLGVGRFSARQRLDVASRVVSGAIRERQILIVIDDVWDANQAMPLLIGGRCSATIVTTRLPKVAGLIAPIADRVYRLPPLSPESARDLLERFAPAVVQAEPEASQLLVDRVERLPLAIKVAGRLLNAESDHGWGVADLLEELQADVGRLLGEPAPPDMTPMLRQTSASVAVLLKKSTDRLPFHLRHHFAQLGVFAPDPATFDLDAMAAVWQVDEARTVARALVDRGLLEPVGGGRVQMHALLVAHAKSLLVGE